MESTATIKYAHHKIISFEIVGFLQVSSSYTNKLIPVDSLAQVLEGVQQHECNDLCLPNFIAFINGKRAMEHK